MPFNLKTVTHSFALYYYILENYCEKLLHSISRKSLRHEKVAFFSILFHITKILFKSDAIQYNKISGYSFYTNVVYLTFHVCSGEMVLNWMILDKLLSCLVHHAELLKHQGSIMESKAYLKEALVLAKKYNLPLR